MEFIAQSLEDVLATLRPLVVEWQHDTARRVIAEIEALPVKSSYTVSDLKRFLDINFDDGLLICRLFLGLSKDQFTAALRNALKEGGSGVTAYRKAPDAFLEALVGLGILEAMGEQTGAPPASAARAVTEGAGDNGIDAIYFDESNRRLYLVQSKWMKNGVGEPDMARSKTLWEGSMILFNLQFERFNAKVQAMETIIESALDDPNTRYEIVIAYTGASPLSEPSRRDLEDLKKEMNDTSEVVFTTLLNQSALHGSLASSASGEPINLQIGIKEWGHKTSPQEAYYGQISGDQITDWWGKYRTRLFARNLRSMLGETDVNAEIRQTLEQRPGSFWYFNNGITIVCRRAQRAMSGGTGRDFATFHCDDISVVNGAQTVGTIGKFGEGQPEKCADVLVPIRIIVGIAP